MNLHLDLANYAGGVQLASDAGRSRWHFIFADLELGAQIKVKYPWLPAFRIDTDAQGNASTNRVSQADPRPSGTIKVTIECSDGALIESVTY